MPTLRDAFAGSLAEFAPPVLLPQRPLATRARVLVRKVTRGLTGSFARHHVDALVLSAVLLIAGLVEGWNIWGWPGWGDDEGTYVSQAWAVQFKGVLAPYTYWYDHPPGGWVQMAGFNWLTGALSWAPSAVDAGRVFILLVGVISAGLVYALARRLGMRYGFAAAAVVLFVFSPLALYFHRMVFLDNIETMWALAAFVLALSPKRRLWAFAGSGACMALSALSKETGLLLLPGLVMLVWQRADRRTRRFCLTMFAALLVLGGSTYLLYAALKGELLAGPGHVSIQQSVLFQLVSRSGSGSVWNASSNAHLTVAYWLRRDTWLPAAGLIASVPLLLNRRLRAIAVTVVVQALLLLRHGYLPIPYVIAPLPYCALALAGVGDLLWGWRPFWIAAVGGKARRFAAAACRQIGPAAALVISFVFIVGAGPAWARSDGRALTAQATAPYLRAEQWVITHIPAHARLITDDTMWVDLTTRKFGTGAQPGGFYSSHVVWFWKLGTDPAVERRFPRGWRSFDYIVATPTILDQIANTGLGPVRAALRHSVVVKSFARPGNPTLDRIEIRRIEPKR